MSHYEWGGDWEVREADIPCPSARRNVHVLDMREPQQVLRRVCRKSETKEDFDKGELVFLIYDNQLPTLGELKSAAASFRKLGVLNKILIYLSPELYREHLAELEHLGFYRDERRESCTQREFVVVKMLKPR